MSKPIIPAWIEYVGGFVVGFELMTELLHVILWLMIK
jgi:hypothetical protein